MRTKQTGFTLVEISIVLVIIGLLLGGVLKGQALIDSAKVKNLAQDFRNVPTMIYAYQDKFRALPGDDNRAPGHLCPSASTCTSAGDANGMIDGTWDSTAATDESVLFWQHVRLAGLTVGATNVADANFIPTNSEGGRIGVQSAGTTPPLGVPGGYAMCSAAVPGKLVVQLDSTLDDGDPETGSMRAGLSSGGAPVSAANIADGTAYVVCLGV
ncbi:MAG: prepilin-type N-terminal cleavage/methylation domain-containing protein [Azoarcus sp.]|jgi:prepilin-type N-terminal cleavage/methylation domain-containing protein|nr:prepilin-type N-terminal cleavage/methylation domain-containing protein [Azoarcus sp.]